MKTLFMAIMLAIVPGICLADSQVNVPWDEFKQLYKQSIEKKLSAEKDADLFLFTIDNASYKIDVSSEAASGSLALQGTHISGEPQSIILFKNIIIKDVIKVTGGNLICQQENKRGILFFPKHKEKFSIEFSFFILVKEDTRSSLVKVIIPQALKNTLHLSLSKDLILLEAPGIKTSLGKYHFSAQSSLRVRFADQRQNSFMVRNQDKAKHFKPLAAPPVVMDTISYFTSFEENGNVLSVLVVDVPKEAAAFLKVDAIPNTDIWSLTVNQERRKAYLDPKDDSSWIIPLARDIPSHVELAVIRKGRKLGLQGRLETFLPGVAFASRQVNVAIALPQRLEMISFEGPLNSASKPPINPPEVFVGRPYYFSRSFFMGQGMKVAVMYKEPAK